MPKQHKNPPTLPATVSRPALLAGGSDRQFRKFVHDLLAFSARLEGVRAGLAGLVDLSGIQYTILISIAHLGAEGEVGITALARHLHLSGAFVTIETNKLARRRLIAKAPGAEDRRRVSLTVTDGGRALLERLAPDQRRVNDELFGCLTAARFHSIAEIVDELVGCSDRALSLLRHLGGDVT
jgi:DNA-binding MarR family transcriptional regulator